MKVDRLFIFYLKITRLNTKSTVLIKTCIILLLSFVFESMTVAASTNKSVNIDNLIHQAKVKNLSTGPYWLALLHYTPSNNDSIGKSEVKSIDFFSSTEGAVDPEQELESILSAVLDTPNSDPNSHAQCKFVARYKWLKKMLDWDGINPPNVNCIKFNDFSKNNRIDSISMVYASGYLSNPGSYYGHPYIKFNTTNISGKNELLDTTVSFGAIIPDNENGLVYVVKGLFGGYIARYTDQQFYSFNHVYGENDLRDQWVYELNLTQDEVNQIVAYTWEILDKDFDYYFLKQNCALRMAELIELIINQPLLSDELPWSIPSTMFDYLVKINHNGTPLVKDVKWVPSRQKRFYLKYDELQQQDIEFLSEYIADHTDFNDKYFTDLDDKERIKILDSLIDYYEYLIIQNRADTSHYAKKRKVLIERAKFRANDFNPDPITKFRTIEADPPHEGPLPFLLQIGAFNNDQLGSGAKLRFRPAYFDHLSIDKGRIPNSTLSMMDVELIKLKQDITVRKVDFIYIENLNVSKTSLPGDGGLAWDFRLAYESRNFSCNDCQDFKLTGGLGKAFSLTHTSTLFFIADFFAESKFVDSENIGLWPRIGVITSPVAGWKSYLSTGRKSYINGEYSKEDVYRWENRFGNNRDWDLRLSYQKHIAEEYTFAISFYW